MKTRRIDSAGEGWKTRPLLWMLAFILPFLFPHASFGADIDVSFEGISPLEKTDFWPGEEVQVSVRLRVLRSTGTPLLVRLRITGTGWHEIRTRTALPGLGVRTITFGGANPRLFAAATAAPGKVSLLADVVSDQDTVSLLGRRHAYLNIRCPDWLPAGTTARLRVGTPPSDMALTADGRYLYVTSEEQGRKVTVIDVEAKTPVPIEDPEWLGAPAGVAPSPSGREMLIADSALQVIHVVDAEAHVLEETIRLNPTGELGVTSPGDVAVNPVRNEAYVTDSRGPGIFIVDLGLRDVRWISLSGPVSTGLIPIQVMLDPKNPRAIYVLCGGLNEVIKLDVVSGAILDSVQLRDFQNPSSLWPAWSMAVNPWTDEVYVVVNPGGFETTYPTIESKIFALPKNLLDGPGRRELLLGSSIWELAVREGGRFVYAIDSYRGEILVIDMSTGTEMSRCAVPVEPGGRLLRSDPAHNRLFVGGWLAGFADIVE